MTTTAKIWTDYKQSGAPDLHSQLVLHYASLVKYVAARVATGLPSTVEQGDLVSYGMFGLIDAIGKFELERGFKFETYAIPRIRGAILDELRSTLGQIARDGILGLDEMVSAGGEGVSVGDTVADSDPGPGGQFEASEIRQILGASVKALPERERMVLGLYYYESMTLAEIGTILGVSESRVCQIHGKAVLQLRSLLLAATRDV